jgi:DNA-binding NarL/FixJ family response regulator
LDILTEAAHDRFQGDESELETINKKLGTNSTVHSILTFIEEGKIPYEPLLEHIDVSKFDGLKPGDIELLDALVAERGEASSYLEIAQRVGQSVSAVTYRISGISAFLGTSNDERVAALYFVNKHKPEETSRELDETDRSILVLKAKGLTNKQVGKALGSYAEASIVGRLNIIYETFQATTATQAIILALENGEITPQAILGDQDPVLVESLDERERQVMNAMLIPSSGGTNTELAEATHFSFKEVKTILRSIKEKLGTENRFHSISIYAAAKKLQEQASH